MRIVFMGNPELARPTLEAVHGGRHRVELVVTSPDRRAGRGRRPKPPPVRESAESLGIPVAQPESLTDPEFLGRIESVDPDLFVVVAFRIIPPELLAVPRLGSVNLHASLLPDLRGAAPINWAIIRGYRRTGLTVFFLEETVDTGAIVLQRELEIGPEETAGELSGRMAGLGAEVMSEALELIDSGRAEPRPQTGRATSAPKLVKEDGRVDFAKDARSVVDLIRGVTPWPGAFCSLGGRRVIIHRARLLDETGRAGDPGEIAAVTPEGIAVSAAGGLVLLTELQMEGRSRLAAAEFWRGIKGERPLRFGAE